MFAVMDANPSLYLFDLAASGSFLWQAQHQQRRRREHFRHQRIWITGASSGLGAELAKYLASCGANLVLSARNVDQLNQVAMECRELQQQQQQQQESPSDDKSNSSGKIVVVPVDLLQCTTLSGSTSSKKDNMEDVIDQVLESMGGCLDCVIFNAGQGHMSPALETSLETTERMFRLNALAPMYATQILLAKLLKQQQAATPPALSLLPLAFPHLVITSSIGGIMGIPLSASYAASKHSLHGYFSSLQAEYPWLRVDMICPGPLATGFHHNSQKLEQQQQQQKSVDHSSSDPSLSSTTTSSTIANPIIPSKEIYKMPVERCAQLVVSAMLRTQLASSALDGRRRRCDGSYHCSWVAPQPTLLGLFLNQHFPSWFHRVVLQTMGPIRVQAWNMGLNVYDTSSWKRARQALQREQQKETTKNTPSDSTRKAS
jgi:short-subunit dehydrogenase